MESLIVYYLIVWAPLGYLIAFLGAAVEGDISFFIFSFLASQGFFNFGLITLVTFLGMIVGDSFLYWLGSIIRRRHSRGRLMHKVERIAKTFDHHLCDRLTHSLIISKFTYGVHKPILIRVGMLGISFKKFVLSDLLAVGIWAVVLGSLGYFSGVSFYLLKDYLHYAEAGILIGLVILYIIGRATAKYSIKKI